MELLEPLKALIRTLSCEKKDQYHRHVSVGDLLTDRWEIARNYGFGEAAGNIRGIRKLSLPRPRPRAERRPCSIVIASAAVASSSSEALAISTAGSGRPPWSGNSAALPGAPWSAW